jgi:serine/threonine protein kinase
MEALAAFEHGGYFSIVLDLAQCTLWDFLTGITTVTYTSQQLWEQVHGLAEGLTYLHGQKVKGGKQPNETMFHQDLKPSNILIVDNVMKISDFGLSDYKPEPRMSESILIGDSKHEGAKVYAPPSRAGRLTDKYDVYSLGAIMSEIACYDIGRAEQVAQYREKRRTDCLPDHYGEGSIQFYYPRTFALKESTIQEHKDLLATISQGGDAQTETNFDEWQTELYLQDPFKLIERMLHTTEAERPTADEIVETLNSYIYQASRVTRNSEPFNMDIWESTISGTVSRKETAPSAPNNRL